MKKPFQFSIINYQLSIVNFLIILLASCTPKEHTQNVANDGDTPETAVVTEGQEAPDFTLNDPDGNPISLSDLRGQYVILDFWGTWCKWCVKGIPSMRAYYEKYQGDFEILSIDFHDDEDTWLKAIDSYDMHWKHAITDEESGEELAALYAIEGFPTKIIVDPEGRIVNISIGEDPSFYAYLDDLFQMK